MSPPPKAKMKNIVIIGDSHARGYAAEIPRDLGKNFEVNGRVMPGARLENVTNLADDEINKLGKNDVVIVIGGANDVNKNETNVGLEHLRTFIHKRHNTNIMIVAAPHRHDLQEASCVNKEIVVFNKKLHEMMETVDYVKIIQADLCRNDFTQHGLHLNISGKEKMAKLLRDNIQKLMSSKEETTLIQKLEENLQDPVQKEGGTNVKKKRSPPHAAAGRKSKGPCVES